MKETLRSLLALGVVVGGISACGQPQQETHQSDGKWGYELESANLTYDPAPNTVDWRCNVQSSSNDAGELCLHREIVPNEECEAVGRVKPETPGNWTCVWNEMWMKK
jgi:hypothetical protein